VHAEEEDDEEEVLAAVPRGFALLKNEAGLASPFADKGDNAADTAAEDGDNADEDDDDAETAFLSAATCEVGMAEADVR
jgi:hypothetical protein